MTAVLISSSLGRLEIALRDLECYVTGYEIPRYLRVNMAGYSIGEKVRIDAVEVPDGLRVIRPDEMIFKITGRRGVKVE